MPGLTIFGGLEAGEDHTIVSSGAAPRPEAAAAPILGGAIADQGVGLFAAQPSVLLGRDDPLLNLGASWAGERGLMAVSGPLGVGKSALSQAFLRRLLASKGLRGARAFGWRADGARGCAGRFLRALAAFLDLGETPGRPSAVLAEALLRRLREVPTLVILDGAERLAHPPHLRGGRMKDPALSTLIAGLAAPGESMALVIGRQILAEAPSERRFRLGGLAPEHGAALLAGMGVLGEGRRLRAASEALGGNPLALRRLARLLRRRAAEEGAAPSIDRRDRLPIARLLQDEGRDPIDPEARRAAAALAEDLDRVERLPRRAAGRGAPERELLAMAGLAPQGLDAAALAALTADPPLEPGEDGAESSERALRARREFARRRLAALALITEEAETAPLRAEPLVGAAARERWAARAPESLRRAERRLYEHHRRAAPSHPATDAEMAPLLAAIPHGAAGSDDPRAFGKVFRAQLWDRALRGESRFALARLGAVEETLSALARFFVEPWRRPDPRLAPLDEARALTLAGFCLRGMARLREAEQALDRAATRFDALGRREDAARAETERAEALIGLGRGEEAETAAMRAMEQAGRLSETADRMVTALSAAAGAARLVGADALASRRLRQAESVQRARAEAGLSDRPRLYSLAGRRLALAFLTEERLEDADIRARAAMAAAEEDRLPLARGLGALTLAEISARRLERGAEAAPRALPEARELFDRALAEIDLSGRRDALPEALIARARFLASLAARRGGARDRRAAEADLERALAIAEAAEMAPAEAEALTLLSALKPRTASERAERRG